jgi:hypothetical protein
MFVPNDFRPELGLLPPPGAGDALARLQGGDDLTMSEA